MSISRKPLKNRVGSSVPSCNPLEDILILEAAQKRLLESRREKSREDFIPWRVFINHIDSYHGKILTDYLSDQFYGQPPEPNKESLNDDVEQANTEVKPNISDEGKEDIEGEKIEAKDIEGKENVQEEKDEKEAGKFVEPPKRLELIGTRKDPDSPIPEGVDMILEPQIDQRRFLFEVFKCGYIIYDISLDDGQIEEATWVLQELVNCKTEKMTKTPKAFRDSPAIHHFILISTVMTWGNAKCGTPKHPLMPVDELDYRKRRAHPNFKKHIQCERNVVGVKKYVKILEKMKTLVVCCGLTYGREESPFHFLFKMGWHNDQYLPIFGQGNNRIPVLYLQDLAKGVFKLMQNWPEEQRYIVLSEPIVPTQLTITKSISEALTTGKVKKLSTHDAFLVPDLRQRNFDHATLNIILKPNYISQLNMQWHFNSPFRYRMQTIVDEYRESRNLTPIKLIVLGPPASGKSIIARKLAKYYSIPYISSSNVVCEMIKQLELEVLDAKNIDEIEFDESDEEGEHEVDKKKVDESPEDLLKEICENLMENNGRLNDNVLTKVYARRLGSKECQNQGYVMDGFPKTIEQANQIFRTVKKETRQRQDDEEDEDIAVGGDDEIFEIRAEILPELVIVLEASDDFLIERVINLPEKEIQSTHYVEEHMLRRLQEYRERNTDDNTPLQFFDELEIHPLVFSSDEDDTPEMTSTVQRCIDKIGNVRNYERTAKQKLLMEQEAQEAAEKAERLKAEEEKEMAFAKAERERKMLEWAALLQQLQEEEDDRLNLMAEPLRQYLIKHVLPTLTQGLIEVANIRPSDPIDYLAEYLFKENPEGKMYEPDYTETASVLLGTIERLKDEVVPIEELPKATEEYSRGTDSESIVDFTKCIDEDNCECSTSTSNETITESRGPTDSLGCPFRI